MYEMKTLSRTGWQNPLLLMVVGVVFFCLQVAVDPCNDDLYYRHVFEAPEGLTNAEIMNRFGSAMGPEISSVGDVLFSVKNHYFYFNNARLANAIAFASNLFPHWVTDVVSALMFIVLIVMMSRFGFGRGLTPWRLMFSVLASAVFLSWVNPMLTADFLMNYLWAGAITLVWLWLLTRDKTPSLWLMLPLSALAGGMHEAYSVAFGACTLVMIIQSPRLRNRRVILSFAVYAVAAAIIIFSPALIYRFGTALEAEMHPGFSLTVMVNGMVSYLGVVVAALTLIVALCCSPRNRRLELMQVSYPFIAAILANLAISVMALNFEGRTAWPANIAAIIIIMRTARVCHFHPSKFTKAILSFGMVLWIGMIVTITVAQTEASARVRDFREAVAHAGSGSAVYFEPESDSSYPFFIAQYVMKDEYHNMQEGQIPRRMETMAVLSPVYRNMPFDSIPLIPGTARMRGKFPWFITESVNRCGDKVIITFGPDRETVKPLQRVPFADMITSVLHGKRIIDSNRQLVNMLFADPLPGNPEWCTINMLPYSALYNGRQIIRIDTVPGPK